MKTITLLAFVLFIGGCHHEKQADVNVHVVSGRGSTADVDSVAERMISDFEQHPREWAHKERNGVSVYTRDSCTIVFDPMRDGRIELHDTRKGPIVLTDDETQRLRNAERRLLHSGH